MESENNIEKTERGSDCQERLVRRGPWDGPVRPPEGWTKMRGVRKGFRKWTNGDSWVTHEYGKDGCHRGQRGKDTIFVRQSPWGIMNWINSHPEPNVKEHATLSAGARVDHGVEVE